MRISRQTFLAVACGLTAMLPIKSIAADDIHCFSKKTQTDFQQRITIFDVIGVDENDLTDAERIDMLEEYELNGWSARLVQMPWLAMKHRYKRSQSRIGKRLVFRAGNFSWIDAWTMMAVERHAEHMSRKTGSRHIYVSPEMRRLARERGVTRRLMRRECHATIAYID